MKMMHLTFAGAAALAALLTQAAAVRAAEMDDDIYTFVQAEELEYRIADGNDLITWDANAWIGNDDHRLAFKTEGEKPIGKPAESFELQFLYRRPVSDFFDVNVGVRHDLKPDPDRTYGVVGLQGLAKQFIETDANIFVSEKGDVSFRLQADREFLLTQRLYLKPSMELNVAFSEDTAIKSGAGVNSLELGLRLGYQVRRELAPYLGVHWERKFGATANFLREDGEDPDNLFFVGGVSFWF